MKKLLLISIIAIISNTCINSQSFRLGMTADFLVENKYLNYEFGPAFVLDFSFKNIPVSIQGKTRFYFSELSEENGFSAEFTYSVMAFGASINYYPIDWAIEPYIGLGVFYNINDTRILGNVHASLGGNRSLPVKIENNFSAEVIGGIKFSANTPINFIVEVTRTFNKPNHGNSQFNFDSLFLKLGLLFQI